MRVPDARLLRFGEADLARRPEALPSSIVEAAACLDMGKVVIVRFGTNSVTKDVAIGRARTALALLRRALVERHGLPSEASVEIDEESRGVPVAPFHRRRFLLPHQDGGHCSFLTPSRLHQPDLTADDRTFSSTVYWRRPSHKLYQGFMITDPGRPPGVTYYYSALALLFEAYEHRHKRSPASVRALARFLLDNVRRSKRTKELHRSRYLAFGALLGSPDPAHHMMPSGPRAESEFWPDQYIAVPGLCELVEGCLCGNCHYPGERLLCHACVETLGCSWPEARTRYERAVTGKRHDLLIACNLTMLHAADSCFARTIRPMCIVMRRAGGQAYERWLAGQWEGWFETQSAQHRYMQST